MVVEPESKPSQALPEASESGRLTTALFAWRAVKASRSSPVTKSGASRPVPPPGAACFSRVRQCSRFSGPEAPFFGVIGGAQGHEILAAVREHGLAHLLQRGLEALAQKG